MRSLDLDDGTTSENEPTITGAVANKLENHADDAAFVTANGAATEGNIYHNTTTKLTRKYDGTGWATIGGYEFTANQDIDTGGTIALSRSGLQILLVSGDGGAKTANVLPFASDPPVIGTIIKLLGQSNTNTLKIVHNVAAGGAKLNGDKTLGANNSLDLLWDGTDYIEQGRV